KRADLFKDRFFKVETFGNPRVLTIAAVCKETFERDGRVETKPAMNFRETETAWIVSPTAFDHLAGQFGTDETNDWIGARIRLRVDQDAKFNNRPCPQFRADLIDFEGRERPSALSLKPNDIPF